MKFNQVNFPGFLNYGFTETVQYKKAPYDESHRLTPRTENKVLIFLILRYNGTRILHVTGTLDAMDMLPFYFEVSGYRRLFFLFI